MKSLIFTLFVALLPAASIYSQVYSSCTPSALLATSYNYDIKDMALQRIYAIKSPDTSLINIPAVHSDSILKGLAAIYNTGNVIQADSVFNAYCIHQRSYLARKLSVKVDPSYTWTNSWRSLNTVTGNVALDNFMSRYGFTVTNYSDNPSSSDYFRNVATIATGMPINMRAFADSLALFQGVSYTYIPPFVVGGTDPSTAIYYGRNSSGSTFTFVLGWGDCPSGCTSNKAWTFQVNSDCSVTFLGVAEVMHDNYRPTPPNCNLVDGVQGIGMQQSISVYPNPVKEVLHFDLDNAVHGAYYTIYNTCGQKVMDGNAGMDVNVAALASGIYFLQIADNSGILYRQTIVKE